MSRTYAWYYDGVAIGGATSKTHTLTSGQTDQDRIECRTEVTYGTDSVAALAEYAAGGITKTFIDKSANAYIDANPLTVDLTSVATNDELYIGITLATGAGNSTGQISAAVDLEGTTMTQKVAAAVAGRSKCYIYRVTCPAAASGNATADINFTTGPAKDGVAWVYKVTGTITTETTAIDNDFYPSTLVGDVNTVAGGVVLAFCAAEDDAGNTISNIITWTGVTQDSTTTTAAENNEHECASFDVVSTETPRTVSVDLAVDARQAGIAVIAIS
jgi:hypothetical protein